MNFCIPAAILIALLAVFAACGEATYEDLSSKEQDIFAREAQVESGLCQHPEITEIWDNWEDWAGSRISNYESLSNSEKMEFLNKFDDTLNELEDKAKDVC